MPIFHLDLLDDGAPRDAALPKKLADALGALLDAQPGRAWVRTSYCAKADYAENGDGAVPRWAFVRVILRELPPEIPPAGSKRIATSEALAGRAHAIAQIVAEHTGRAIEDVHVYFDPPAAGRIAFGGELVLASPGDD